MAVMERADAAGAVAGEVPADALQVDVAVVGGGPTGLVAALLAAGAGYDTALIAPEPDADPRTTALLMPAIDLLDRLGVWETVAPSCAALTCMRLIDDTDRLPRAPELAFDAHEIDLDQFGFNVPTQPLVAALEARLPAAGVTRVTSPLRRIEGAPARLITDGPVVSAELTIAADGSESMVREAAGIGVRRWTYDQAAFVTMLAHERPHGCCSIEFHTPTGPFTLVPLPGNRSSLVWMSRPADVERWMTLDPGPLAREIELRAHRLFGQMRVDGPRGSFAMMGMIAHRFGAGRVVLVGEAAHRFPPIGAQGLNLGLRDAAVLGEVLASDVGFAGVAERYDRRRRLDVGGRTLGVDLFNRSLLSPLPPVTVARAIGHLAARNVGPVRRAMMRVGLG